MEESPLIKCEGYDLEVKELLSKLKFPNCDTPYSSVSTPLQRTPVRYH